MFSTNYTLAIQILLELHIHEDVRVTSLYLSQRLGSDKTSTKEVMLLLKTANLISNKPGPGGTTLVKPLTEITLYDVYSAVCHEDTIVSFYSVGDYASHNEHMIIDSIKKSFNDTSTLLFNHLKTITLNSLLPIPQ